MKRSKQVLLKRTWPAVVVGLAVAVVAISPHRAYASSQVPVAQGNVFGGFSSQRWPSFFTLTKDQQVLVIGSIALTMKCTSGTSFTLEDDFSHLPIASNGKFHGTWVLPVAKLSDGTAFGGSGSMTARLDRRRQRVTGTWHDHSTFVSSTGQTDQCDSGIVRFTALQ